MEYANNVVEKQADIHDQYKQAKSDFDKSCQNYQTATMQRAEAEKRLHDITQKLMHNLNDGLNDPTVPQAPSMAPQLVQGGQMPPSRY